MSLFNFLVSSAIGVTPEELSAAQKATEIKKRKKKQKDSVHVPVASSSSTQAESSASGSNPDPRTDEASERGKSDKETREAESERVSSRLDEMGGVGEGELPTYSAASVEPPAYSRKPK